MACDWPSIVWAYSEQETEIGLSSNPMVPKTSDLLQHKNIIMNENIGLSWQFYLEWPVAQSHNAPILYPKMLHFAHVRTSLLQNVHCGILVRCIVRFFKYGPIVLINNYLATSFMMNKQQAIIYINDQFTHWMIHGTRSKKNKQHEIFQTWRLPLAIHIDGITYLVFSWSNAFLFSFLWLIKCRITVITWYLKRFIPFLVPLRRIFRSSRLPSPNLSCVLYDSPVLTLRQFHEWDYNLARLCSHWSRSYWMAMLHLSEFHHTIQLHVTIPHMVSELTY